MSRGATALLVALIVISLTLPVRRSHADAGVDVVALVCAPELSWDCGTALAIVWRESNYQPAVVNSSSGCAGLFQICPLHGYSIAWLQVPENNVAAAYLLWLNNGWWPWRTS